MISFCVWFKLSAFRREDYDQVMWNQNGSLWLQFYCKMLNSFIILNSTPSLMPLRNSLPCCTIKHTKRSVIKSNKFILAEIHFVAADADIFNQSLVLFQKDELLIHILHLECVTSFDNSGWFTWIPELHVVTSYMANTCSW